MSVQPKRDFTVAEYLAIERLAETRSEYFRGEMFAMSGASRKHNLLCLNVSACIHQQIRHLRCEVYQTDMRVKVCESGLYTYPDVVATCEAPQFEDEQVDSLLNPQVLVEVLSESTENYDRGKKFEHYRRITSLQEYLLISQDRLLVELYTRRPNEGWLLTVASRWDECVQLTSIDCSLPLAEIYAKVEVVESNDYL